MAKKASNLFKVSQSKAKTYRKCRYAYHLRYVEKLRRIRKSRPLQFGSMVHEMLETYANAGDPFKKLREISKINSKLFRSEREMYGEIVDDIHCIMSEYFKHWGDGLKYVPVGGKRAEHEFEIDLVDGIVLTGKIDAIARTPNRLRWLTEHKTFNVIPSEDHRWRNLQSCAYMRVNEILGWPALDGVLWDYIRSKPPSRPQVLKSGEMSKRGIDSLPSRVIDTLEENGLNPKDKKFQGLIEGATKNRNHYFQRIFTPVKRRVVDRVYDDLKATAVEMAANHGKTKTKCIDRHCDWCDYEPICRAELQGLDADFIIERQFYVHEKDDHKDADSTGE